MDLANSSGRNSSNQFNQNLLVGTESTDHSLQTTIRDESSQNGSFYFIIIFSIYVIF